MCTWVHHVANLSFWIVMSHLSMVRHLFNQPVCLDQLQHSALTATCNLQIKVPMAILVDPNRKHTRHDYQGAARTRVSGVRMYSRGDRSRGQLPRPSGRDLCCSRNGKRIVATHRKRAEKGRECEQARRAPTSTHLVARQGSLATLRIVSLQCCVVGATHFIYGTFTSL